MKIFEDGLRNAPFYALVLHLSLSSEISDCWDRFCWRSLLLVLVVWVVGAVLVGALVDCRLRDLVDGAGVPSGVHDGAALVVGVGVWPAGSVVRGLRPHPLFARHADLQSEAT